MKKADVIQAIKNYSSDIFIQTETITTGVEIGKYPIQLNNNYKYCKGVIIDDSVNQACIIGIIDKGKFILDEAHVRLLRISNSDGFLPTPLNTIADGTQKYVYFDKNGQVIASIKLYFILTNDEIFDKKINLTYDQVPTIVGASTGTLFLNQKYKVLKGVYAQPIAGALTGISLRAGNKTLIEDVDAAQFTFPTAPLEKKFIPVYTEIQNIDYEFTNTAVSFAYFIFLYE